jgi:hypothetical protein
MIHKVSIEHDQDPRYGWVRVELTGNTAGLIIVDVDNECYGFEFKDGLMTPTCICRARSARECACPNDPWDRDGWGLL